MAGISSKAVLKTLSAYKYNGGSELEDEGGLDYYNTFYRKYDAQIGRFTGVDVMAEADAGMSPYHFGGNNPILFNDPLGNKKRQMREEDEDPGMRDLGNNLTIKTRGMEDFDNWFGQIEEEILEQRMNSGGGGCNAGADYLKFWNAIWNMVSDGEDGKFSGFASSEEVNKKGATGIRYTFNFSLNDGVNGEFGEMTTLGTEGFISLFISDGDQKQKKEFPAFSTLWSNYPQNINGKPQHPSNDYLPDQCAIRLSVALIKSGIDLKNYKKGPKTSEGYVRGCEGLAQWLNINFPTASPMTSAQFEKNYWNSTGIIFISFGNHGGHIDLWNAGTPGSGYYQGATVYFWPIK